MAEDTPQDDKTEEPTARRLEKAREDGQVLRSQDLTIAVVTSGFIATLYVVGSLLGPQYVDILARSFSFERYEAFEVNQMVVQFASQVKDVGIVISPLFAVAGSVCNPTFLWCPYTCSSAKAQSHDNDRSQLPINISNFLVFL